MSATEEADVDWVKSSLSVASNACVELSRFGSMIFLRDSKNPTVHLSYSFLEIEAFLYGAKRGEFDHLLKE